MRPPKNKEARVGSAGLENKSGSLETTPSLPYHRQKAETRQIPLVAQLDHARDRLDRGVDLLQQAIDLRQMLGFQIDLDHAVDLVGHFTDAVRAYRGAAS